MQRFVVVVGLLLPLIGSRLPLAAADSPFPSRGSGAGGYMYNFYVPPAASTPWRPAWSPDGREIAFSMSGSIWKIRVGDTTAYELTANPTYDSSPAWSPDGRWVLYTTEALDNSVNLMLLNVATGESSAITEGPGLHLDPVWSPDGERVAFVQDEPERRFHIYYLPFENGRFGEPVRLTEPNRYPRSRLYFGVYDDHIQPTWSPDGKEIILVSNRGIPLGSGAIWRAPVKPDAMSDAKRILREETLYRTKPQWSPDGTRILYSSHRGSQYSNLYVLPTVGGEPYQLTFGEWDHFDPAWSPDGEWIVYVSNEHGVSDLRLLKSFGGKEKKVEIRRRVYRRPMGKLEVFVRETASNRPTAARIHLVASDNKTYAPPNAYHRTAARAAGEDFFHTRGHFVIDVPPGSLTLEAVKGIEYWPSRKTVEISEGRVTTVVLELERMTNMNALGWWSGSDHVHMNYGGNLHNTPENLLMMAAAEDLDHVGEKVANKDNRIFDHQHHTGEPHRLSNREHLLTFGEEYRPPFYGHINFINLTEHLISPFTTGYEGTAIDSLYPSNTDMFRLAAEQGALGGYVHPWSREPEQSGYGVARGFPVDTALGTAPYLEVLTSANHFTNTSKVWHRALNCGFRVTASAGEDSISNLHATPVVGSARLYAYLGPELRWDRWLDAIRQGRTIVTNGPLVFLDVNGRIAGGEVRLPAAGGSVEIKAQLQSIVPVEKMELFFNGEVIETIPLRDGGKSARFQKRIEVIESGWMTVRASGSSIQHPVDDSYVVGETSAVFVLVGDRPIRSKDDAEYFIKWIDDITRQAEEHPGWRSERERKHVLSQFAEARQVFVQQAREAQ